MCEKGGYTKSSLLRWPFFLCPLCLSEDSDADLGTPWERPSACPANTASCSHRTVKQRNGPLVSVGGLLTATCELLPLIILLFTSLSNVAQKTVSTRCGLINFGLAGGCLSRKQIFVYFAPQNFAPGPNFGLRVLPNWSYASLTMEEKNGLTML